MESLGAQVEYSARSHNMREDNELDTISEQKNKQHKYAVFTLSFFFIAVYACSLVFAVRWSFLQTSVYLEFELSIARCAVFLDVVSKSWPNFRISNSMPNTQAHSSPEKTTISFHHWSIFCSSGLLNMPWKGNNNNRFIDIFWIEPVRWRIDPKAQSY